MYFQITSRCNMSCAHCCFSCDRNGKDMSLEIFTTALDVHGHEYVTLGGGEPTLHPHFWEFVTEALLRDIDIFLVTNGSRTRDALLLASLAKKGALTAELSQDEYHDPICKRVIQAFTKNITDPNDRRGIRTVTQIMASGRAEENQIYSKDRCACDDLFMNPDGDIYWCGCQRSKLVGRYDREVPESVIDLIYEDPCYTHYFRTKIGCYDLKQGELPPT